MATFTYDQIEAVVNWMNTFDQLKDTAIPVRFKEDFIKQAPQKPAPIGIMPTWLWKEKRKSELLAAITRYSNENLKFPVERGAEFHELSKD